jgi:hypothetical protein
MNLEERIKTQLTIIIIALVLMALTSFNFAIKGTRPILASLLGVIWLGIAFCLILRKMKNKR